MSFRFENDEKSSLTDEELIESYRNDDTTGYILIKKYAGIVTAKAKYLSSRGGADSDDLVQEGFLGLLNAIRTYRNGKGASFSTYATRCIENKMKTAIRKHSRVDIPTADEFDDEPDDNTPETLFFDKENSTEIENAIMGQLSRMESTIFRLFLRGENYEEISGKTGVSVKSVDNALQRSRKKLKEAFVAGRLFNKT